MSKKVTYDFCSLTIHDNYLIVVINEGEDLTPDHNQVLVDIAHKYFKEKPFVYITHRLYSYSVDPKIYYGTSKIPNLVGFAVVSKDYKAKTNAEIEKLFFNKPFEIFTELEDAVVWAENILAL